MQYLYSESAGINILELKGQEYKYLAKVRRVRINQAIRLRNLKDDNIYRYRISDINRQRVLLTLLDFEELIIAPKRYLHLGWAIIDSKNIQKYLPSLNEIGVSKITFFYATRSQKSYKIDFEKLKKILIHSSEQSGRSKMMELDFCKDTAEFLEKNPNSYMLNFSQNLLQKSAKIDTIIIGPEGGFTEDEQTLFKSRIVGLDCDLILQSQTAAIATASIVLL